MSVRVNYKAEINVVETLETNIDGLDVGDKMITHNAFNSVQDLGPSSTVPVTKVASWIETLTGGADEIDFCALPGVNGATVVGTGLRVQAIKIKNQVGNAVITIAPKASTDNYDLLGASFLFKLLSGQEITFFGNELAPEVGSGTLNVITITGTSSDDVEIIVVMG